LIGDEVLMSVAASSARTPGESVRAARDTPSRPSLRGSAVFSIVFSCWIKKVMTTGAFLFCEDDGQLQIA
jgi:hypothetical protein